MNVEFNEKKMTLIYNGYIHPVHSVVTSVGFYKGKLFPGHHITFHTGEPQGKVDDGRDIKVGQFILFDLELCIDNQLVLLTIKSEIKRISHNPHNLHPSKCIVDVGGSEYGIPFDHVKQVFST